VQRGVFASTAAAREAGLAIGTAPDPVTCQARAERAAQLAVEDQSVDATDVRLVYVAAGADCEAGDSYTPTLAPGEEFSVCVTVTVRIPLLPEFIDANTATGRSSYSATATSTADEARRRAGRRARTPLSVFGRERCGADVRAACISSPRALTVD
jgi:hypothetical protein